MWERGLKLVNQSAVISKWSSLPMWERGLKLYLFPLLVRVLLSLPMWERGLKQSIYVAIVLVRKVAPHVGAWIETSRKLSYQKSIKRRSPCGSVD